ncbi:MAG: hypothetical protein LBF15_04750 [Candidatus Peribacteria bacterium]|jgi:hypothetical protein|nr:hypothetical protein [Candidatus Peribacteria bacterium]
MDHIDKTPPTITLKKNGLSININSGTISSKAANFTLELFDATTRTCLDDAKIDYTIKI